MATIWLCDAYVVAGDASLSPDGRFHRNVFNTSIYLLSSAMQINNFVVNYRGHPFTQSIKDNKPLWYSVMVAYGVLFIAATEILEPLNDILQLAPLPAPEFRSCVICILGANFGLTWIAEKLCQRFET